MSGFKYGLKVWVMEQRIAQKTGNFQVEDFIFSIYSIQEFKEYEGNLNSMMASRATKDWFEMKVPHKFANS